MKKKIGILAGLAASFIVTGVCAKNDIMNIVNDGYIDITGTGAKANSVVTLEIVDVSVDLSDYDTWKGYEDNGETTAFFGTTVSDADGNYEFNIYLPKSGAYVTRIGNEDFEEVKVSDLNYTNVEESKRTLTEIKEASAADDTETVKTLISENRYAIGLQSNVYEDADFDKTSGILASYIKENSDLVTEENIATICEKAMIISLLDSDEFTDLDKYAEGFGIRGMRIEEFYDSDFSKALTSYLKDEDISSVEEYNSALEEGIIVCLVNDNGSVDNLKAVLLEYADDLGLSESKITTEKCRQLMKKGIDSTDDIEDIINQSSTQTGGGNGGGGGDYGSKTSKKPAIQLPQTIIEQPTPETTVNTEVFSDLDGYEWAKESIVGLYREGIINGRAPRVFAPSENVLREEFVKMIVGTFELSVIGEKLTFSDVADDAWYTEYIECAYHSNIVKGYSDEIFGIGDRITRQDAAVMVVNAAKACDYTFGDNGADFEFTDEADISDYAKEAVKTLVKAGIISGDENGRFNPKGNATRAEAAKILYMTLCNTQK